jgi:hypothetical protein
MIALNEWLLAGSELARLSVRVWQESGRSASGHAPVIISRLLS